MPRTALLIIALSASPLLTLAGQGWAALAPGDRVRLTTTSSALPLVGTVVAADSDSVRIRPQDIAVFAGHPTSVAIARGSVRELEVGVNGPSHAGTGALIGLGMGAVVGALWGVSDASTCRGFCFLDPGAEASLGAAFFGGIGAGLGALIGLAEGSEHWQRVPLSHAHVALGTHGAGLALSFAF
jgi:hypothetical protein